MYSINAFCKKTTVFLLLVLLSFLPLSPAYGQAKDGAASGSGAGWRDDAITLKVAVIGPGNELYFWWGHIGLVVEDEITGRARFFDWGVFSFENENFFVNFAYGRLIYTCAVTPAELNFNEFIRTNRDVTLYTLDLPDAGKKAILRYAENNMLPENRDYAYHHFKDNCATRIRDILDLGLGGQFKAKFGEAPGRYTLRQHVMRHTWFNPFFDWILNFWMGQDIDRPTTVWEEMFLPSEIALRIKDFQYTDSDGNQRPLVKSVEVVNKSHGRPVVLDKAPVQWPRNLVVSLVFSGLILFVYIRRGRHRDFKIFIGLLQSLLGLFFGAAGSILFFMTFFTNHDYTYHNSNIIFVNPIFFAAIPLGIILAFTKIDKKYLSAVRISKVFWTYIFLGDLLTMVIKIFPGFYQQNQDTQVLLMPAALVMIFIYARLGLFNFFGSTTKVDAASGKIRKRS